MQNLSQPFPKTSARFGHEGTRKPANNQNKEKEKRQFAKHFPIDQYLHDRMTPATLSPTPLTYEKPIHPAEMPHITTCTELPVDDTNKLID